MRTAIQSVLNQIYPNIIEIIIIDDSSTDNTEEVIKELLSVDHRILYKRHVRNRGVLATKNTGLDLASGEFIGILDDDDELFPDAVNILINKHLEAPMFKIIFANCIRSDTKQFSGYGLSKNTVVKYEDVLCGRVHGEYWGIFAKALLGADRFNENMRGLEGHLWLKLYQRSDAYYIHKPVRLYRVGHTSIITTAEEVPGLTAQTYGKFIEMYKEDFVKFCPKYLSKLLYIKAYFAVISGSKKQAIKDLFESFRYNFLNWRVYVLLIWLPFPTRLVKFLDRWLQVSKEKLFKVLKMLA